MRGKKTIKVVGAGEYGVAVVDALREQLDADLIAADISIGTLRKSKTENKVLLGFARFHGLDRSTYSCEQGRRAADMSQATLARALSCAEMVIVVSGTSDRGGGIAQVAAGLARNLGVPTVISIVALPYTVGESKEENHAVSVAATTIQSLQARTDILVILSPDRCWQFLRCQFKRDLTALETLGAETVRLFAAGRDEPLAPYTRRVISAGLSSGAMVFATMEGESFESLLKCYVHPQKEIGYEFSHADTADDILGTRRLNVARAWATLDFALRYGELPATINLPFLPKVEAQVRAATGAGFSEAAVMILFLRFFFRLATGLRLSKRSRRILRGACGKMKGREAELDRLKTSLHRIDWEALRGPGQEVS